LAICIRDCSTTKIFVIGAAILGSMAAVGPASASPGCLKWTSSLPPYGIPNFSQDPGPWTVGDVLSITANEYESPNFPLILRNGDVVAHPVNGAVSYTITPADVSASFAYQASTAYNTAPTLTFLCIGGGAGSNPSSPSSLSQNLRSLQIAATQSAATISGQVTTGAVGEAIGDAFSNGTTPIIAGANGLFLSFAAEPQRDPATQKALDALAYAGNGGNGSMTYRAPRAPWADPGWSAWADLRGTGFDQNTAGIGSQERQVNVNAGIGKKLSPDLLVGLFTGYEDFSFTMSSIGGKLTGDGGTIGAYAAARFSQHWRADAMFGWTDMFYDSTAGTASGSFTGSRWLGSGGFIGTYGWGAFVNEPSAHIDTLWERDNAFTDTLSTTQPVNNFSASRVSVGDKISYPWQALSNLSVAPYLGFYADFHFQTETALPVGVPFVGIKDGWSERVTGGVTMTNGRAGPSLSLAGELGGLGAGYDIWSANARANWPF
jgi:Autotransporter beta-domain